MSQIINPHLTIVVATYNAANCIYRCLESIYNQSYKNWECFVVDGGSMDGTLSIVSEFELKDSRFRHISEKDAGIFDAFNKGWRQAKGEWVYYLGSDDEITRDGMEKIMQVAVTSSENIAVINGGTTRIRQDGSSITTMGKPSKVTGHQKIIMRRSVLEQLGGFDLQYRLLADYDLFTKLNNSHYGIIAVDAVLARFYAGGASEKISNQYEIAKEKIQILRKSKTCKYPLLLTMHDSFRTISGSICYRLKKKLYKH